MRRLRFCAVLLLLLLLLPWLPGCGSEPPAPESRTRPVTLAPVRSVDVTDTIRATGQLLAKQEAQVAAEVAGRVTEVRLDEGQAPAEGESVIAIDPERRALERDRTRAALDETRASLAERVREHRRVKELFERGVASQSQLDQAATELALARTRIAAAEANLGVASRSLRDAEVRAPFAGLIDRRLVSEGEYVQPGQALFELVSLSPILVEFRVTEVDSARVSVGQQIRVRVAPYPDEVFPATVSVVAPTIDTSTRTLLVKGELPNEDGRLRPGLFAHVDLGIAKRSDVLMVPEEAVLQRADGSVVFRLGEGNRVERLVVETGRHDGGSVEVATGLAPGDLVVARGQAALVDGEVVDPRNPDGSRLDAGIASGLAEAGP